MGEAIRECYFKTAQMLKLNETIFTSVNKAEILNAINQQTINKSNKTGIMIIYME